MIVVKFLLFLLSVLAPGYLLASILGDNYLGRSGKLALVWLSGTGLIGWQLFIALAWLKLTVGWWFYLLLILETGGLWLYWYLKRRTTKNNHPAAEKLKWPEWLMIFLLVIILGASFVSSLARPTAVYDSVAIWSIRAKEIFYQRGFNFNADDFAYLGGVFHNNYPWHLPLTQAWLWFNLGEVNETLVNLIDWFYFLSMLILIITCLRRYLGSFAWLFALLPATMPLFFYHSFNGYADLPLAAYLTAGFIFFFTWLQEAKRRWLWLAGLFLGLALLVKNEAIIFVISGLVTAGIWLAVRRQSLFGLRAYVLPVLILGASWWLFLAKYGLNLSNVAPGWGWYPEAAPAVLTALFLNNSWNIWWWVVAAWGLLYIKTIVRTKELAAAWLFVILAAAGFLTLYFFTAENQFVLNQTAVSRNILLFIPLTVLLVGWLFVDKKVN